MSHYDLVTVNDCQWVKGCEVDARLGIELPKPNFETVRKMLNIKIFSNTLECLKYIDSPESFEIIQRYPDNVEIVQTILTV